MKQEPKREQGPSAGDHEGARKPSGGAPVGGALSGPLAAGQRWSAARKQEVVILLIRGESIQALSRELGVEVYRLEEWRDKGLKGIEDSVKVRQDDPIHGELDEAHKRIGELMMENELLRKRIEKSGPLILRRSRR